MPKISTYYLIEVTHHLAKSAKDKGRFLFIDKDGSTKSKQIAGQNHRSKPALNYELKPPAKSKSKVVKHYQRVDLDLSGDQVWAYCEQ